MSAALLHTFAADAALLADLVVELALPPVMVPGVTTMLLERLRRQLGTRGPVAVAAFLVFVPVRVPGVPTHRALRVTWRERDLPGFGRA